MSQVKGSLLLVRVAFLEQRCTPEDRERVLADLDAETRALLAPPPDANEWVPFPALVDLTRAIDQVLGRGDLALAAEVGRFAAEVALASVREAVAASRSPAFLFRQAPSIWHQHYDSGTVQAALQTATTGRLRVTGFDTPAREHCASVRGWIERTIELTGMLDVAVDHALCRTEGAGLCQYDCRWRVP